MVNASTTSPFAAMAEDVPWVLWQQQTSVTTLPEETETDRRSVSEADMPASTETPLITPPVIQRMQYNAVLSRINQAARKTGSFSSWKP